MLRLRATIALILLPLLLALAFLGGATVLRQRRFDRLERAVPSLDPEFARHLAGDSERDWVAYCRQCGTVPLSDALQAMASELRTPSFEEFRKRRAVLEAPMLKVAIGFERAFDFPAPARRIRFDLSLSDSVAFEVRRLEARYIAISTDIGHSADERVRMVDDLAARFTALGDPYRALYASIVASQFEMERGRPDRRRARLVAGIAAARRYQDDYILCQLLGEMGDLHGADGSEDSLALCYDEGVVTALRHGFIDQAARLLRFYAGYYAGRGRLALALDRLAEAQRLCGQPGAEGARLRMQLEYTRFVADLGCWDLVARGLRRVPPLLRTMPRSGRPSDVRKYAFDSDLLRARLAFAEGRVEQGSSLMRLIDASVPGVYHVAGYATLLDDWSAGLESCGRVAEAIAICDRGIVHCDSTHLPDLSAELMVRKARLLDRAGRADSAERVLSRARLGLARPAEAGGRAAREAEILAARLAFHRGRVAEAKRAIERVFRDYRRRLDGDTGESSSVIELGESESLRAAIHEIERFDPAEGYCFESEWRSLGRNRFRGRRAGSSARPAPGWPDSRRPRPVDDAIHLTYWFDGTRLLRWTARPGGVALDTLPLTVDACLDRVRHALESLQTEAPAAGAVLGPRAFEQLRALSESLLPRELAGSAARPLRLEISPDGPLVALPFEALPAAGPRGMEPLALWADVAYVRGVDGPRAVTAGPAVVVSNPRLSTEVENRYGWAGPLSGSVAEAQSALARWPHAVLLSGDRATKEAIRQWWPRASIVYLAAHHVRDPDAPFLGFVPLSAPAGAAPEASLLEIADVRALDLSGCRLAVLASCSSGAPYRTAVRPGPSLGDAFLDSGARAVVRSFWDVGDAETREFMRAFLASWREDGDDAAALGRARRAVMATPAGRSPRVWAAWSVLTTRP